MVTNYIKNATYKEIYDIHTDTESTSILTFHTPVNLFPKKMLKGFFDQYRRFKYRGATVRLQPVARLPADPEQISYEAGEPGIDPRDMVNPVLVRGYCGDSLGTFLNRYLVPGAQGNLAQASLGGEYIGAVGSGFMGSSVDKTSFPDNTLLRDLRSAYLEKLYYQSLGDPHFQKIGAQRGMKRFFYPLVYDLATTTQYLSHNGDYTPQSSGLLGGSPYGGLVSGLGEFSTSEPSDALETYDKHNDAGTMDFVGPDDSGRNYIAGAEPYQVVTREYSSGSSRTNRTVAVRRSVPILTSNKRRLGWLDTDSVVVHSDTQNGASLAGPSAQYPTTGPDVTSMFAGMEVANTTLPLINMGIAILPKAYKTEMCWRLSIVHHFDFKDFRPMSGLVSPFDNSTMGMTPILEWSDWDDYGMQVYAASSVTSTSKNVELIDVEGSVPDDLDPAIA